MQSNRLYNNFNVSPSAATSDAKIMIINEGSLCFGLLFGQRKQFEDITIR